MIKVWPFNIGCKKQAIARAEEMAREAQKKREEAARRLDEALVRLALRKEKQHD